METPHTNNASRNKSTLFLRSVLPLVGIVIAVICSLVSLKEIHSAERVEIRAPRLIETPKLIRADLLVNAATTIWSLGDRIH
jgi:hypothetical protein